jgi:hypothetical protein
MDEHSRIIGIQALVMMQRFVKKRVEALSPTVERDKFHRPSVEVHKGRRKKRLIVVYEVVSVPSAHRAYADFLQDINDALDEESQKV